MNPIQLRETTMDRKTRGMIRITLPPDIEDRAVVRDLVDRLMGNNPAHRYAFIQENAAAVDEEAIDA
jgi:topoisomerase-4 subunit B